MDDKIEVVAKACHEANRAYCESIGDNSQKPWEEAEEWQRESARNGVQLRIDFPETTPEQQHEAWLKEKIVDNWQFGKEKNAELKIHPCLVPYAELSPEQKQKDLIFVDAFNSEMAKFVAPKNTDTQEAAAEKVNANAEEMKKLEETGPTTTEKKVHNPIDAINNQLDGMLAEVEETPKFQSLLKKRKELQENLDKG